MVTASHLLGGQVGSTAPVFLAFLAVHVISGLTAVVTGAPPRWRVRAAPGIRGRAGLNGKRWIGSHPAPGMRCHGALTVGEVYGPGLSLLFNLCCHARHVLSPLSGVLA